MLISQDTCRTLPGAFSDLSPFVDYWAVPTIAERIDRRVGASYSEIARFYDAMIERVEEILAYLDRFPPDDLPPDVTMLYELLLGMIQAAIAVELHGQAKGPLASYPNSLTLISGRP